MERSCPENPVCKLLPRGVPERLPGATCHLFLERNYSAKQLPRVFYSFCWKELVQEAGLWSATESHHGVLVLKFHQLFVRKKGLGGGVGGL